MTRSDAATNDTFRAAIDSAINGDPHPPSGPVFVPENLRDSPAARTYRAHPAIVVHPDGAQEYVAAQSFIEPFDTFRS